MKARRACVAGLVAGLVAAGTSATTAPAHSATAEPTSATAASDTAPALTVPAGIAGEVVRATGRVAEVGKPRAVQLQRRVDGTWTTIASARTSTDGTFAVLVLQPRGSQTYRATAPAVGGQPISRTPSVTVKAVAQELTLTAPRTAVAGTTVPVKAQFSPARPDRPMRIERRDGDTWMTVAEGVQGPDGTARTRVAVGAAGTHVLRLTAHPHEGAPAATTSVTIRVSAAPEPTRPAELVSAALDGRPASMHSQLAASDRAGRWVAFTSRSSDLGVANPEGHEAVWLRDTERRTTRLVSRTRGGAVADGDSTAPAISADGRFVVYGSDAADLTTNDRDLDEDVFLFDRTTGTTTLLSVRTHRTSRTEGRSLAPAISPNGRYVTFASDDPGVTDQDEWMQVIRLDRETGGTALVSAGPDGPGTGGVSLVSKVADTGLVAFQSSSPRLTGRGTSQVADVFLHAPGQSALENVTRAGNAGGSGWFDLSADGSRLVFQSQSWNLPGAQDDDDLPDVFLLEREGRIVRLLSTSDHPDAEHRYPSISDDGRTVTWLSVRDESDGARVLQLVAADVVTGVERAVTSVLADDPSASTVWPLDLAGDGSAALVRTRRPDLTGATTALYDQVVRVPVPR